MEKIAVSEIKPADEYNRIRDEYRERLMAIKKHRRVTVGPYLNFLFENRDTMLYQIQEMVRAEGIKDPRGIAHEVETYNQLVPSGEELKATLLIEIDDPTVRKVKLSELVGLERCISLLVDRDYQVDAVFDEGQLSPEKISSVQFITFPLGAAARDALLATDHIELVVSHPACSYRTTLSSEQVAALAEDLRA